MITRVALSLGLFVGSMTVGFVLGRSGLLTEGRARRIIRLVIMGFSPIVLWLTFWRVDLRDLGALAMPIIGAVVSTATLLPAWLYSRSAHLSRPQTGSFLNCAMFSNLGYLGAFLAFAMAGEAAYGLAMLYLMFFSPWFYLLGFSIAKRFGAHPADGPRAPSMMGDELRLYPFVGLLAGIGCSLLRLPRPALCESVNQVMIPLDTALYLAAIGSQMRLEWPRRWWRASVAMSAIKFWYAPLIGLACAQAFGLRGVPRFVVLLQSAMPMGVSPLMLPTLFGVDRRLTNALWIATNLLAIPWLLLYLPLIR